jgi:hypothetical protein
LRNMLAVFEQCAANEDDFPGLQSDFEWHGVKGVRVYSSGDARESLGESMQIVAKATTDTIHESTYPIRDAVFSSVRHMAVGPPLVQLPLADMVRASTHIPRRFAASAPLN